MAPFSNDPDALPRPFGPYLLITRLARGGMGEVFLAKHGGLQGFEKYCVVKTLRKDLDDSTEYVSRFTEEARVVVQLNHRNICSVFDVGRAQGQLYVAMELIVGRDLRALSSFAVVKPAIAIHIIAEVLEALDYAHRMVDAESMQALGLVHRDVTPHNILLGVEGDVKLIDFGIATSARVGPVTDDGTVLGKLTYMSPEHARGDPVDGRSDQFAAGVVLTELLTGVAFSSGLSRAEQWKIAGVGGHRPMAFQTIEPELRGILDRALSPNAEQRFATCSAFGDAVVGWARKNGHVADARDVRRAMTDLFPGLNDETRRTMRTFKEQHAPSLEAVVKTPGFETIATTMMVAPTTAGFGSSARTNALAGDTKDSTKPEALKAPASTQLLSPPPTTMVQSPSSRSSYLVLAAGIAIAVVGVGVGVAVASSRRGDVQVATTAPTPTPTPTLAPTLAPPITPPPALITTSPDPPLVAVEDERTKPKTSSSSSAAAAVKPNAKLDPDTKRNVAFLASSCVSVVPCAQGVIDWSRRHVSDSERHELADSAADCAKTCRARR